MNARRTGRITPNFGEAVNATSYGSQCRAMHLLAVTHNIMTLLPMKRFLTDKIYPLFYPVFGKITGNEAG